MKSYSVALAFALFFITACGQLDDSAVASQGTKLESTVADAGLLAGGTARGELTAPYVQVQAGEVADDAAQLEDSLQDGQVSPSARHRAARLRAVARQVASAMRRLEASPGDAALAGQVGGQIDQARAALQRT
jgi:hypothetical protein